MSRNPSLRKKLKSRNTREADWEPLKAQIIELHISQGLSLQEVRQRLQDEYGFDATIRQYRSRISKWNLDKNIKSSEMRFMAQKQRQRRIVEPDKASLRFRVRGLAVDPAKIERWKTRTGFSANEPVSPLMIPDTPSGLSYTTDSDDQSISDSPAEDEQQFSFIGESVSLKSPSTAAASSMDWEFTSLNISYDDCRYTNRAWSGFHFVGANKKLQEELLIPENTAKLMGYRDLEGQNEDKLRRSLLELERRHGTGRPETLETQEKLACLMLCQKRWKPAEDIIKKLLDASRQCYGNRHEDTAWAARLLGDAVLGQLQWMRAERLYQNAYDLLSSILGPESPRTLSCLAAIANNLSMQSRHREASILSLRLFQSTLKLFGQSHPLTVVRAAKLAESYFHSGQSDKAEALFVQVLSAHAMRLSRRMNSDNAEIVQVAWYQ